MTRTIERVLRMQLRKVCRKYFCKGTKKARIGKWEQGILQVVSKNLERIS
jgi:hypothetical protein